MHAVVDFYPPLDGRKTIDQMNTLKPELRTTPDQMEYVVMLNRCWSDLLKLQMHKPQIGWSDLSAS